MIRVLFFASLREAVGRSECEIPAPEASAGAPGHGLEALMAELRGRLDEAAYQALAAENVRVAVNRELVEGAVALKPGDEVAFLPPVTGG